MHAPDASQGLVQAGIQCTVPGGLEAAPPAQQPLRRRAGGSQPPSNRTTVDSLSDWGPDKPTVAAPSTHAACPSLSAAVLSAAAASGDAFTFSEPRVLERFRRRTDMSLCDWAVAELDDSAAAESRDFPGRPLALQSRAPYNLINFERAFAGRGHAWGPRRGLRTLVRRCIGAAAFAVGFAVTLLKNRR